MGNQKSLFGSAVISSCELYRYRLDRHIGEGKTFAYFGINPSTACADIDDATVRKWIGFTRRNGGGRFIVGNVFAYRSTDVKGLGVVADPIGPQNDDYLKEIINEADVLVPCWGKTGKVPSRLRYRILDVIFLLMQHDKPLLCFGVNADSSPRHPLMLSYETELIKWEGKSDE